MAHRHGAAMKTEHVLTISSVSEGVTVWELVCTHYRQYGKPDTWRDGEEPCWLQTWWPVYGDELVVLGRVDRLPIPVVPVGWEFDTEGIAVRIGTIGTPPPSEWSVWGEDGWDDERVPFSDAPNPRVAAELILRSVEWDALVEGISTCDGWDNVTCQGLVALLDIATGAGARHKVWNSLHAWVTSRMEPVTWCTVPHHSGNHYDYDYVPFGCCFDEDGTTCAWAKGWALFAAPDEFTDYALHLLQEEHP